MPYLAKILLYPIKSFNGVDVEHAKVFPSGALEFDREFAIVDQQGKLVNGKSNAKIHLVRSQFNFLNRTVSLQIPGSNSLQQFHLDKERQALAAILSDFLGMTITLQQNSHIGFPDNTNLLGPTVISTATLTEVASWFPGMSVDQMRRRIRANIEIADVPPFWEDQLFSTQTGDTISFRVGNVCFFGVQPCERCVIPIRDPDSGIPYPNFQKIFVKQRQATLPDWVASSCFNHFYSLGVNTRLLTSASERILEIGNKIEIFK
ncbi:MAG: MOSC N-terminal beta barrel domain-containing protein [Mojavia pulchra JT2-VF2]|jgi:uncharacterized protein YcbX|uniref:MOSC N-terminal beta barrel domain-containing protein n=1 Tax=Mojavia pulchra JT2-VF2 TaxID=287848 RepID=A0A951PZC8_9NOST|nr:MOSC N-terminal beta barrel domain-containing protein [Mojavia pulchra JT2-VF2]